MENRGKQFEGIWKSTFDKESDVDIERIPDQSRFINGKRIKGSKNTADFRMFSSPCSMYIECKTSEYPTLSIERISQNQRDSLYDKTLVYGQGGFVVIWYVKEFTVVAYSARTIKQLYSWGVRTLSVKKIDEQGGIILPTRPKKVKVEILAQEALEILRKEIQEKDVEDRQGTDGEEGTDAGRATHSSNGANE